VLCKACSACWCLDCVVHSGGRDSDLVYGGEMSIVAYAWGAVFVEDYMTIGYRGCSRKNFISFQYLRKCSGG